MPKINHKKQNDLWQFLQMSFTQIINCNFINDSDFCLQLHCFEGLSPFKGNPLINWYKKSKVDRRLLVVLIEKVHCKDQKIEKIYIYKNDIYNETTGRPRSRESYHETFCMWQRKVESEFKELVLVIIHISLVVVQCTCIIILF